MTTGCTDFGKKCTADVLFLDFIPRLSMRFHRILPSN